MQSFGQLLTGVNMAIAFSALAVIVIILIVWLAILHAKISRLLRGSDGKSLESSIVSSHDNIRELQKFEEECVSYFTDIEHRLTRSIQAIETARFNPFKGSGEGGNQSFATALISEKGDGVVVSSLYSRDRVSVFSKPVAKFESEFDLTEEESDVIAAAQKKLQTKASGKKVAKKAEHI